MDGSVYTGSFVSLSLGSAATVLDAARDAGFRVTVHLTGGRDNYQNADGSFSVRKFNSELDKWRDFDLQSYIDDGTVIGHMLFDEPQDPNNWDGRNTVPYEDIEAVAAHSKSIWPDLPTGIGSGACWIADGAPWTSLDFTSSSFTDDRVGQYNRFCDATFATAEEWLARQVSETQAMGMGLVISINVLDGGESDEDAPIRPVNLQAYGTLFAAEPHLCLMTFWTWDDPDRDGDGHDYFAWLRVKAAMNAIAAVAAQNPGSSCAGS